ncbi:MAG: type 1 glutamine amidotransferase [Phyllobacteriaceae bacterium]|nr:type 1 glutamine amidotransferase [Phyllobacteriaceae bacterium]
MRVLVVHNYDNTELGLIARALDEAEARLDRVDAHMGDALPGGVDGFDGLVVLGGGQSAVADDDHPYLPDLAALMRDFAVSGRAVLGVCLGSQILARGLGAKNLIGQAPEFGWKKVRLTDEGMLDPVMRAVPREFPIFQWHDDTFSLPDGAVRLAANPAAQNQAFRFGRAAYGIQFHFEADTGLVEQWNETFAGAIARDQPHWPAEHAREAALNGRAADAAGLAIARAWTTLI